MPNYIFSDNVRELSTSTGTGSFTTTGGSVVVPTAAIGRAISDVASVSDMFDYVIHHEDNNEWEIGVGTYQGTSVFSRDRVVASSAGTSKVSFTTGNKAVWIGPTSENINSFMNTLNIVKFGATAGGTNTTAIAAARTFAGVNKPIVSENGATSIWGTKQSTLGDFGGDTKGEGSLFSASQGTTSNPSTVSNPLIYLEKFTSGGAVNDHGCLDLRIKKVGGTNYTYGLYTTAENAGGGAGRVTPFASLLNTTSVDAVNDCAGVFYAQKTAITPNGILTGIQVAIADTSGQDTGWLSSSAVGANIGFNIENAVGRSTFGHRIGNAGTLGAGFYTGILIDTDAILPDSYDGQSEGIRINGASSSPGKFTGIQFGTGYLSQGINLVGPTYDSGIMMLAPKGSYITFGTTSAAATRMRWTSGDVFSVYSGTFGVEGTQVLGARVTGWTTPTGTPTRTGFATSTATATDVAEALCALITDLKTHGMIGT